MSKEKSPNVLVIELVDKQDSNYVMDPIGSEEMENALPQPIDCPSARRIRNTSVMVRNGKHVKIRYIKGCDEIEVEKQKVAGFEPNPSQDQIWIIRGRLTVTEYGGDIGLYRYVKAFHGNVDNPARPEGAHELFREINTEVAAESIEEEYDTKFEIMKYLNSLKVKTSGNNVTYREDRLQFLCSLFQLPPFDLYASEAWVALMAKAEENPEAFLSRIKSETKLVEVSIHHALTHQIIEMDRTRSFLKVGESKKLLQSFKETDSESDKIEKLVDFFTNPKNRELYHEVQVQVETRKEGALAVQ